MSESDASFNVSGIFLNNRSNNESNSDLEVDSKNSEDEDDSDVTIYIFFVCFHGTGKSY